MNITLKINDFNIEMGSLLNVELLKSNKINKAGFLTNFLIPKEKGDEVYWSKNCNINFCDEVYLNPVLDPNMGADLMYGTSVYLYYNNKKLVKVIFQIVGNKIVSNVYEKKIYSFLNEKLERINENSLIWRNDNNLISIDRISNSSNVKFIMFLEK